MKRQIGLIKFHIIAGVVVKECTWPITKPPALLLSPVCFRPFQNNKSHKENGDTKKEFDSSLKDGENIDWTHWSQESRLNTK